MTAAVRAHAVPSRTNTRRPVPNSRTYPNHWLRSAHSAAKGIRMRGKHGASAAVRAVASSAQTAEEGYRRAIVRLTNERDEARNSLAAEQAARIAERRTLLAQIQEAVSPELHARDELIEQLRDHLGQARAQCRRELEAKERQWKQFEQAAISWGIKEADFVEIFMPPNTVIRLNEDIDLWNVEATKAIQRARGRRA